MANRSAVETLADFVLYFFSTSGIAPGSETGTRCVHLAASFRTITTLIHTIDSTFLADPNVSGGHTLTTHNAEELRALRVLTALAIAISRGPDVAAVVTSDHRDLENGEFRVIASHHLQLPTDPHQFFALRNPHSQHPELPEVTSGASGAPKSTYQVLAPKIDPAKIHKEFLDIQ
jgi:hypothetical protein